MPKKKTPKTLVCANEPAVTLGIDASWAGKAGWAIVRPTPGWSLLAWGEIKAPPKEKKVTPAAKVRRAAYWRERWVEVFAFAKTLDVARVVWEEDVGWLLGAARRGSRRRPVTTDTVLAAGNGLAVLWLALAEADMGGLDLLTMTATPARTIFREYAVRPLGPLFNGDRQAQALDQAMARGLVDDAQALQKHDLVKLSVVADVYLALHRRRLGPLAFTAQDKEPWNDEGAWLHEHGADSLVISWAAAHGWVVQ